MLHHLLFYVCCILLNEVDENHYELNILLACWPKKKIQFHADFQAGNCIKDVLCWKTPLSVHLTTWTLQTDHFAENEDNEQKNLFSADKHK